MRRFLRTLVALAITLTAWLVVSPARADSRAPLCDSRGAITFAPAPQLQGTETSIETIEAADECLRFLDDGFAHQGDAPKISTTSVDDAMEVEAPIISSARAEETARHPVVTFAIPRGTRERLDRPPR